MKKIKYTLLLPIAALMAACFPESTPTNYTYRYTTVIVNEGDTISNLGSVNYYDEETTQLTTSPTSYKVQGKYQSARITSNSAGNGYLWIVTNDIDDITIFDATSGTVTPYDIPANNLKTPRYIDFYGRYIFVTNWGVADYIGGITTYPNSYVAVFDQSDNMAYQKSLPCGEQAEGLLVFNNRLFVATGGGVKVFDITTSAMTELPTITSTRYTGKARQILADINETLWVSFTDGGIMSIDPVTCIRKTEYDLPVDPETATIAMNIGGTGILSYSVTRDAAGSPTAASLHAINLQTGQLTNYPVGAYNLHSLGVSFTGAIYTADTKYTGKSKLLILDQTATITHECDVDAGTKNFTFFATLQN